MFLGIGGEATETFYYIGIVYIELLHVTYEISLTSTCQLFYFFKYFQYFCERLDKSNLTLRVPVSEIF